jgi:hypothetical protein
MDQDLEFRIRKPLQGTPQTRSQSAYNIHESPCKKRRTFVREKKSKATLLADFTNNEYIPITYEDLAAILIAKHMRLKWRGIMPLKCSILVHDEKDNLNEIDTFIANLAKYWELFPFNTRFQLLCYFNGHYFGLDIKRAETISMIFIDSTNNSLFCSRVAGMIRPRFDYRLITIKYIFTQTQKDLKYCGVFALNNLMILNQYHDLHEYNCDENFLIALPDCGSKLIRYSQFKEDERINDLALNVVSPHKGTLASYNHYYQGEYLVGSTSCCNTAIIMSSQRLKQKAINFWQAKSEQDYDWWLENRLRIDLLYNAQNLILPSFYQQIYNN